MTPAHTPLLPAPSRGVSGESPIADSRPVQEVAPYVLGIMKGFKPLDGGQMREVLARTMQPAQTGNYEKFKTATMYDGTALHPELLD